MTASEKSNAVVDVESLPKAEEFHIESLVPDFEGKMWFQLPHIRKLCFCIFVISFSACNHGYDASLLNSLYSEVDFNNAIGNVIGVTRGALTSAYVLGCFISFFPTPYFVDTLGRVPALFVGNSIMLIGVIIQSCAGVWYKNGFPAHNTNLDVYGMLIVARLILGFGVGIIYVAAPALISELAFPTHRQASTTFYQSSWYLGAIVVSWVSFGARNLGNSWNWRIPTILQAFFPLSQIILVALFVPESPRFYISQGKIEKAREVLDKYHGGGYPGANALIDFELAEMQIAIEQGRSIKATVSYSDFFKTAANRKRLWVLCCLGTFMQLSGNGLVSYYISLVLDSIGIHSSTRKLVFSGGLTIYNYGICIIQALMIVPRMKRRHAFIISGCGMLTAYVIWTILSAINQKRDFTDPSLANGVLAMIFIYYLFYNLGFNGIPFTYATEVVPFKLRGKGLNVMTMVQHVWSIYNAFVNSIAMDAIEWKYYIVYCCILAVESLIIIFTFVETSGYTLEEVAKVFGDAPDFDQAHTLALETAKAREAEED